MKAGQNGGVVTKGTGGGGLLRLVPASLLYNELTTPAPPLAENQEKCRMWGPLEQTIGVIFRSSDGGLPQSRLFTEESGYHRGMAHRQGTRFPAGPQHLA